MTMMCTILMNLTGETLIGATLPKETNYHGALTTKPAWMRDCSTLYKMLWTFQDADGILMTTLFPITGESHASQANKSVILQMLYSTPKLVTSLELLSLNGPMLSTVRLGSYPCLNNR